MPACCCTCPAAKLARSLPRAPLLQMCKPSWWMNAELNREGCMGIPADLPRTRRVMWNSCKYRCIKASMRTHLPTPSLKALLVLRILRKPALR